MNEMNEIKLPKGADRISVTQHNDRVVIEFIAEKPKFKEGDFLHSDLAEENITIIYRKKRRNNFYYHANKSNSIGLCFDKGSSWSDAVNFRLATESEKKELIDALTGAGKCWNIEKKCIEDIPVYKNGDFVVSDLNSILIFKEAKGNLVFDHAYLHDNNELVINKGASYNGIKRRATTEEKQRMIEALAKKGKRWNAEKKCVEDIQQPKFKVGDKVRIKDGISSKTHERVGPGFNIEMDKFIGERLTVEGHLDGFVFFNEDSLGYQFDENWLEPYTEEIKKGDLAIFWDDSKKYAIIRIYERSGGGKEDYFRHRDHNGSGWKNAIKFESKEQYERFINS